MKENKSRASWSAVGEQAGRRRRGGCVKEISFFSTDQTKRYSTLNQTFIPVDMAQQGLPIKFQEVPARLLMIAARNEPLTPPSV